ncbi:YIP1 family protein [Bacillus mycoides]|uniref:YIP1 family protein n=1 Tax=Bacillus mycoides TaxID=1405 RepID=UPI0021110AFB|nr:YIP1 family protein [Bacillus mycoides]MCQ6530726.1 YIP1 family protein [Bacillus mycoides]
MMNFINIFFSPKQVFEKRLKKSNALLPLLFISCLSVILSVCTVLTVGEKVLLKNNMEYVKTIVLAFAIVAGIFSPLMGVLINSIINYIALIASDIHIEFRKLMIVGFYAYMPVLLEVLLKLIVSLYLKGSIQYSPTSLGIFLSNQNSILSGFSNSFSGCVIWSVGIYIIGVLVLAEEQNIKAKRKIVTILICTNLILTIITSLIFSPSI